MKTDIRPEHWDKLAYTYAFTHEISWYHAMADIKLRRRQNGDEEAFEWFVRRAVLGESIAWNTKAS